MNAEKVKKAITAIRKEVVALATTHSAQASNSADADVEKHKISRSEYWTREVKFLGAPVWALVAFLVIGIIEWIVLFAQEGIDKPTLALNRFPDRLNAVVFGFNFLYVAPALILMVIRRSQRFGYWPFRLGLMFLPNLLTFPGFSIYAFLMRTALYDTSKWLGMAPWIGILAIVFHALFGARLCHYLYDDGSRQVVVDKLATARQNKQSAEAARSSAASKVQTRQTQFEAAQQVAEEAKQKAEETGENQLQAKKAYDELAAHKKLSELEREQTEKQAEYDKAKRDIADLKIQLRKATDAGDQRDIEIDLEVAQEIRDRLQPYFDPKKSEHLQVKIEQLRKDINDSNEKRNLEAAEKAHQEATAAQATANKDVEDRKRDLDGAKRDEETEAGAVTQAQKDIDGYTSDLSEAQATDQGVWRDFVFVPGSYIVLTFIAYLTWYGHMIWRFN